MNEELHEFLYNDLIRDCLSASGATAVARLARGFRRALATVPVSVVVREKGAAFGGPRRKGDRKTIQLHGARCNTLEGDPSPMKQSENESLVARFKEASEETPDRHYFREDDTWLLRIGVPNSNLTIYAMANVPADLGGERDTTGERVETLAHDQSGAVALHNVVRIALSQHEFGSLESRVRGQFWGPSPAQTRMVKIADVLEDVAEFTTTEMCAVSDSRLANLLNDVAEWGLHQMTSKWGHRCFASPRRNIVPARSLAQHLNELARLLPAECDEFTQIRSLVGSIEALAVFPLRSATNSSSSTHSQRTRAYCLLEAATRMHQYALEAAEGSTSVAQDNWVRFATMAKKRLPKLLAYWWQERPRNGDGARSAPVHNWLRVWLVWSLLQEMTTDTSEEVGLDSELWMFRADLSYVVRESVRFVIFQGRPGFAANDDSLNGALATVVEHHARLVVELPRELDIRVHLRHLDLLRDKSRRPANRSHLRHVLDVYILGQFLLSIGVPIDGEPTSNQTMLDSLASRYGLRPGRKASSAYRRAFSLAALFHHVGAELLPGHPNSRLPVCSYDEGVQSVLHEVEEDLRNGARQLIKHCINDLEAHDCLTSSLDAAIGRWAARQHRNGDPDPQLLSAWYLLHASRSAETLAADVVTAASRAVLLLGCVNEQIETDQDPAAALLVICDELCDWEPRRRHDELTERGWAGDEGSGRDQSKIRTLWVDNLVVCCRNYRLEAFLEPTSDMSLWPRFGVELRTRSSDQFPVVQAWMLMAQRLGRIRSNKDGWGVYFTIRSDIPQSISEFRDTKDFLSRVVQRTQVGIRARLESWVSKLSHRKLSRKESGLPDREQIIVSNQTRLVAPSSMRDYLPDLLRDAARVMAEREHRIRLTHPAVSEAD